MCIARHKGEVMSPEVILNGSTVTHISIMGLIFIKDYHSNNVTILLFTELKKKNEQIAYLQ